MMIQWRYYLLLNLKINLVVDVTWLLVHTFATLTRPSFPSINFQVKGRASFQVKSDLLSLVKATSILICCSLCLLPCGILIMMSNIPFSKCCKILEWLSVAFSWLSPLHNQDLLDCLQAGEKEDVPYTWFIWRWF